MYGIFLIPCSFYKRTPRNDFLNGEWTDDAREFVGVVRVEKKCWENFAQSLGIAKMIGGGTMLE